MYVASRDIERGEELLIDYGDEWWEVCQCFELCAQVSVVGSGL